MIEHHELTIYDPASDTVYIPVVWEDGRVGYRVLYTGDAAGRERFVYLNPSDTSEDRGEGNCANVFLYEGSEGEPAHDEPIIFVKPWENTLPDPGPWDYDRIDPEGSNVRSGIPE